eukprot:7179403-Karenia_brevis.AAC.1
MGRYQQHAVVREALAEGKGKPLPLAVYVDGVQYSSAIAGRSDTVCGVWLVNLVTQKRHLIAGMQLAHAHTREQGQDLTAAPRWVRTRAGPLVAVQREHGPHGAWPRSSAGRTGARAGTAGWMHWTHWRGVQGHACTDRSAAAG